MIYTPLTRKAMRIACKAHDGQFDIVGFPYIFHPIHIAERLRKEDETIVALLHDAIESPNGTCTIESLRAEGFSEEILEALRVLAHDDTIPYMEYIERISHNELAAAIKKQDVNHNFDLARLDMLENKDMELSEKYRKALLYLILNNNFRQPTSESEQVQEQEE